MTRRPGDDLFEETRMSFGEHLEELRKTLVRSLIGIAIGCIVGFMVAENVVNFLQTPLKAAIKKYHDDAALIKYTNDMGFLPAEIETRMQRDGLSPETVQVDPDQLVKAIRSRNPEALAGIDLTPYRFMTTSIVGDPVTLASSIIEPGSETDPETDSASTALVDAVREEIAPDDIAIVKEISDRQSGGNSPSVQTENDRKAITAVLNRLIDRPSLHQNSAFESLMSNPDWSVMELLSPSRENQLALMKKKVDENPEDTALSRRLNRILVARTFPESISAPVIDLVPMEIWTSFEQGTQALSPHEVFMVWIKAAIVTGLVLAGPWVFFQLWLFVAAGLYPHEQKYVYYYLPISILLFLGGVCLAFFFVFEPVLQFLFSFNASMGIAPQLRIGEWLSFVMFLPLGFGIAFQLPLVMLFAYRVGLVPLELYVSNWRIAILVISVLSMLLTPADPISMLMLGVPLTILYFFGIALCRWMPRSENPFGETDGAVITGSEQWRGRSRRKSPDLTDW